MTTLNGFADTFTRRQAREAGYGPHEIAAAVRSGRWRRLRRDTFVLAHPAAVALTREQDHLLRAQGVAAKLGAVCILSHQTAVLVRGLPVWGAPLDLVHVTRIGAGTSRTRAGVTTHLNRLVDGEETLVRDIRVTTVARSLVDMACVTGFEAAVCSMDAALGLGHTDRSTMEGAAVGSTGDVAPAQRVAPSRLPTEVRSRSASHGCGWRSASSACHLRCCSTSSVPTSVTWWAGGLLVARRERDL